MKLSIEISVSGTPLYPLVGNHRRRHANCVKRNINSTGFAYDAVQVFFDQSFIKSVDLIGFRNSAIRHDLSRNRLNLGGRATGKKDPCTFFRKSRRDGAAYGSSSPINHCDFVLEQHDKSSRRVVSPVFVPR